jgi:hypothetical protein
MDHLRRLEEGLYDANENLIEERLADLKGLPLPPPVVDHTELDRYRRLIRTMVLPGFARYGLWRLGNKIRRAAAL